MSSNRYGQIWHGDRHHINIRFPSNAARLKFQEKFEAYHQSHDHDGAAPTFKAVTTKDLKLSTGSRTPEDMSKRDITIDGYHWSEIRSYQDNQDLSDYNWYRPPTCCVPPTIVIDSKYVSSADLKRHPLSAIFGNMPDSDFQSLVSSVEKDGFIDPVIRTYQGQILDGWHRYRAAQELGIIRKLRFREWHEDSHRDGDPKVFVLARNIERRHLSAQQRAQIAVTFNERFGHGTNRFTLESPNGDSKTRQELAKEAGVGTSTIDRAVQVEKAGKSEEVISGEKSAGEVIAEETVKSLWEQINPAISAWKKEREGVGYASKSMFIHATLRWEGLPKDTETSVKVLKELLNLLTTTETDILEELIRKQLDGKSLWEDPEALAEKRKLALDAENRMFNALDEVAPDWDYDDFIAAACDKHSDWGVTELPDIDYTEIPAVWEERYNLLHTEITEPAAWIQEMLDKMAESETQETARPTQTAEEREANKLLKQKKQVAKSLWDTRIQAARDYTGDADSDLNLHVTLSELEKGFAKCEAHKYCADAFQSGMRRTSATSFNICLKKTLESDVSLEDLEAEYRAVSTYALDILQWKKQEWIQHLIDKKRKKAKAAETSSESTDEDASDAETLLEKVEAEVPKWKARYKESGKEESELVSRADLSALIHVYRNWENASGVAMEEEAATAEELEKLLTLLTDDSYAFIYRLRDYLRADDEAKRPKTAPEPDMNALWDAFNKRFPKWKAKYAESGYRENDLIQKATEAELFDALRVYRDSDRTGPVTAEEIKDVTDLMKSRSYPFAIRVRDVLRDKHKQDFSEIDRCYAQNHLRVLRNTLSPLLERLGADDMLYHHKDILTADLYDVFLEYENVPTEKEMIIALLDVVDGILSQEIADGRFDTLDNEVLCPDDEADRQAMNSDLVTSAE